MVYTARPLIPRFIRRPYGKPRNLVNISGGGLQYIVSKPVKVDEKVSLLVKVPAFLAYLMFRGRIVWSQKIPKNGTYRVGVEFSAIEKETRGKLESLRKNYYFRKKRPSDDKIRLTGSSRD